MIAVLKLDPLNEPNSIFAQSHNATEAAPLSFPTLGKDENRVLKILPN